MGVGGGWLRDPRNLTTQRQDRSWLLFPGVCRSPLAPDIPYSLPSVCRPYSAILLGVATFIIHFALSQFTLQFTFFLSESGLYLKHVGVSLNSLPVNPLRKTVSSLMGSIQCLDAKEASCLCLLSILKSASVFAHCFSYKRSCVGARRGNPQ